MGSVLSCVGSAIAHIGAWFVSGVLKVVGTIFEGIWKGAKAFFEGVKRTVENIVRWLISCQERIVRFSMTAQTCGVGVLSLIILAIMLNLIQYC